MAKKKSRTKKKPTKTAIEFNKLKKRIREQERYYRNKGFDTVSVVDTFAGIKPSRSALSELKKYAKLWTKQVDELKKASARIQKEKGVSAGVAYKYLSARAAAMDDEDILDFDDVVLSAFMERVNSMPNYKSREMMGMFVARLRNTLGDEEAARLLAEAAENEEDFEAVLQYEETETALYNTYQLMQTIMENLDETEYPIATDELRDFMDSIEI